MPTDYSAYTIDQYFEDIHAKGVDETWDSIITALLDDKSFSTFPSFLAVENFGELYEHGLAEENKVSKKELGKYYTPIDVATVMSQWLIGIQADNIADVACGTGNLILTYLSSLDREEATTLIMSGRVWLYDLDDTALRICEASIAREYGLESIGSIHVVHGNFLDDSIMLPDNCKVISNPPYAKIDDASKYSGKLDSLAQSKDLYAGFMEKIIEQSIGSVIISPYSFIGASKFSRLREVMGKHSGHIVSFDNVPAAIFNGRKKGIFNTNTANSVRAAITTTKRNGISRGYRVTPLLRFSSDERSKLLDVNVLESYLSKEEETPGKHGYAKCYTPLRTVLETWNASSDATLKDFVSLRDTGNSKLCIPTTCRYYLPCTVSDLARSGKRHLYLKDEKMMKAIYAIMNSSLPYWHWRLYDGGVTYSSSLLLDMPMFEDGIMISLQNSDELISTVDEMMKNERKYLTYKKNGGAMQENVKFPDEFRDKLNKIMLRELGLDEGKYSKAFKWVHSPRIFSY